MKQLAVLCILIFVNVIQGMVDENNCIWKYKCCKYHERQCVEMCKPEIECKPVEEVAFVPFQVFNTKCRFGFKSDNNQRCRKII